MTAGQQVTLRQPECGRSPTYLAVPKQARVAHDLAGGAVDAALCALRRTYNMLRHPCNTPRREL